MNEFSTQNLEHFFTPERLQELCRILAALDTVFEPDDSMRYHSYFPRWSEELDVAKIDNGSGDHVFFLFSPSGIVVKGFDHESPLSPHAQDSYKVWPGIYDTIPTALFNLLDDPAFEREDVTFCLWRLPNEQQWQTGSVQMPPEGDDGSSFLLGTLFPTAHEYWDWAQDYYEQDIPENVIEHVYLNKRIDEQTAQLLNPEVEFARIADEICDTFGGNLSHGL